MFFPTRWIRVFTALVLISVPEIVASQQRSPLRDLLKEPQIIVRDDELSTPLDYVALSDGSVVAVEFQSTSVTRYANDGTRRWKVGREGSGPGEFRVPYRLALLADQSVLVFDIGTRLVTRIDSAGGFSGTLRADMELSISSVVVTPSGDVLVAGSTNDPRGREHDLHLFSANMKHKRSFGGRPVLIDERYRRVVGPGTLGLQESGGFFHTIGYPYEVLRYSWSFTESGRVRVPVEIDAPEAWVTFSNTADGRSSMRSNLNARRPLAVLQIGADQYLGAVSAPANALILFNGKGVRLDTMPRPEYWSSIATYNQARRQLWVYGERNDEPVLMRIQLKR